MKLIDKAAVVAEIENIKSIEFNERNSSEAYACMALDMVKEAIDTLEVKEVNLEKEANECWNYVFSELGWDKNSIITMKHDEFMAFAKHFFELGIKAQKGE